MVMVMLFALGAILGSFAGAVIWRLRHGRSVWIERSECEKCHHKLGVVDLIPIVSWAMLRGKCRYCHKKVSPSYTVIEITLGLLFALSYQWWPGGVGGAASKVSLGFWLVYLTGMAILFVYDMRWRLLPDVVVSPLIALAILELLIVRVGMLDQGWQAITEALIGAGIISGFFAVLYLISKGKWIGFGDVKLGIFMGIALGMPAALFALLGSYYLSLFVVVPLLLSGKVTRKSHIAFGPFLLASFVLSFFLADQLTEWFNIIF